MTAPGFLVTGSGRSGTGYLAAVLNGCGMNIGHEGWWNLDAKQTPGLDGDVSWLGCFDHGHQGPVYAQVRDPRTCIPSIAAHEGVHPWWLLRAQHVELTDDPWINACRIWYTFTQHAVERAAAWWRLEDINPGVLEMVFGVGGDLAEYALAAVPQDVNHRGDPGEIAWPTRADRALCVGLARELGYKL